MKRKEGVKQVKGTEKHRHH